MMEALISQNFADSEVFTVVLVAELCQVKREHDWLRLVRSSYKAVFPPLSEDSRFSQRDETCANCCGTCGPVCCVGRGKMSSLNAFWTVFQCRRTV